MRELFEIRAELSKLDNKRLIDDTVYRRLMLELMLHNAVQLKIISASNGGDSDWRYEQETVTTEDRIILPVKKGDEVMVRISNWDDEELRVVYVGTDGPVSVDQGIPIQPGEEKVLQIKADLHAISPYVGDLVDIFTSDKNLLIPLSEDGGVTWLRALVAPGQYDTGQAYALACAAALNSVGASVYTVTFNVTTRKLTYTSDGSGGTFDLGYLSGDGANVSNWREAGFLKVDKTGLLSYTSDEVIPDNPIRVRIGKARPFKKRDRDYF